MTDVTEDAQSEEPNELASLTAIAASLGMKHHPSIKAEKLKLKIEEFKNKDAKPTMLNVVDKVVDKEKFLKKHTETLPQKRIRLRKEATVLRRVIVTCLNPAKSNYPAEPFSASNSFTGDIGPRLVPFNTEKGTHVEQILLNVISERTFTQRYTVKDPTTGGDITKDRQQPEFAITYLDELTPKELQTLADRQAKEDTVSDD